MYVIKSNSGFAKIEHGKLSITTDIAKATRYSYDKANTYLKNQVKLKDRNKYSIIEYAEKDVSPVKPNTKKEVLDEINHVNVHTLNALIPLKNILNEKIKYYDNVILDIRHYIRDDNTKLNAADGYKVFRKLQLIERERASVKKELQRCSEYITDTINARKKAQEFEYEPYIPREITDMSHFLNE